MSNFYNVFTGGKKAVEVVKKVFGKGSKKNLTPELEALKGFKVSPKGGKTDTRAYKENLMQKRLGNEQKKMEDFATEKRNKASKELFKNK